MRLILLLILMPAAAMAGPWLREEGATYLSFSAEISDREETDAWLSVYAERGIRERLTLGIDAGGRHDGRAAKALLFARVPIVAEGNWRVAAQLGAGATLDVGEGATLAEADIAPVIRPGLAVGRGLDLMAGGWAAADLFADVDAAGNAHFGLDAILGLRPDSESTYLLGLRASDDGIRLVPGYERGVGPARIALSAVIDPEGDAPAALSLRTAIEF